jgi:hypothetical protein
MENIQATKRPSDVDAVEETITGPRKEHKGVILIPRPSDDPLDPLVIYPLMNL